MEQRILDAVRDGELVSTNAIVKTIGARRQDVYAIVRAMFADGRLYLADGIIRSKS